MKLTNGDIFVAREPLQKLLAEKFPVKTSYQLAKLANKFNEQLKIIEEVRNGLVNKYGEKDEKGIKVKEGSENWVKFVNEFNELMEQEVEIVFEKVKLPDFEVEPTTLMALEKFIDV